MRILVTEFMDAGALARLAALHETRYAPALVDHPAELAKEVASADALIVRNRTRVDGALVDAAKRLAVVGRLGVGLDNIDVAACEARKIAVIPATGANARSVAEYVIAAAMMLLRGAYAATADVASGRWPRAALSAGREISGKTIGIVGFGGVGRETGRLARAIGMRVLACDPQWPADAAVWSEAGAVPRALDALLAQSDVVTLHIPLAAHTRGLIDASGLSLMRPDAILINTARGGVVDEAAVAAALREGRLGGAALDVFETEPLPAGSALAGCPNLLLTPHIAGLTAESSARVSGVIADGVLAHLAATGAR